MVVRGLWTDLVGPLPPGAERAVLSCDGRGEEQLLRGGR
jgi:hypothetical protein